MTTDEKFRLVTRSDFDGLVCAVLLEDKDLIDDILCVHPKDMQAGTVPISNIDITTNLPYVPGCHMAFDHHESEVTRLGQKFDVVVQDLFGWVHLFRDMGREGRVLGDFPCFAQRPTHPLPVEIG